MTEQTFRLVWLQTLTGGREVMETGLTAHQVMMARQEAGPAGPGGVWMIEAEEPHPAGLAPSLSD